MENHALGGGRVDQERREHARGKGGVAEDRFNRQRAAGDVGRVLQQADVACHQCRRGEAEDLPQREVPRHDRQHRTQGVIANVAARGVGGDVLRGEIVSGVVGEVVAGGGAFLHLRLGRDDGLAHLAGHQGRKLRRAGPQDATGAAHQRRAVRHRYLAPADERLTRGLQSRVDFGGRMVRDFVEWLFSGGVDRSHGGDRF